MRRIVGGALALLALLPAVRALDSPKPGTPAEQYQALLAEYQETLTAYQKAVREAKNNKERQKAIQSRPNPGKFAPRFMELAEKHPKDPAAVSALVWVATNGPAGPGSLRAKALDMILRDHLKSDKIASVCEGLARGNVKENVDTLKVILAKSPHATVKGAACMALASQYQARAQLAGRLNNAEIARQVEKALGKDTVEEIRKKGEAGLNKEAEALLERVVKEFPDVKDSRGNPLGRIAADKLLGPGRPAPEIEGEDTDGKAFKLSDYKGKVVLLDFWGHW